MSGQTNGARGRSQHIRLILHPTCVTEPAVDGCPLVAANSAHGVSLPHARKLARKNPIVNPVNALARSRVVGLCRPAQAQVRSGRARLRRAAGRALDWPVRD
jgi:hypothetical protein